MGKREGSIWHRYKVWARAVHIRQIKGPAYTSVKLEAHHCENCGMEFKGEYCPRCGQTIHVKRFQMRNILKSIYKDLFNLEDGFLFTLKELFWRPGYMIRDYLQGKRKPYFKPFQLLFVLGALYFILTRVIDPNAGNTINTNYYAITEQLNTLKRIALTDQGKEYLDKMQLYADSAFMVERIAMEESLLNTGEISNLGMNDYYLRNLNRLNPQTEEEQARIDSLKRQYLRGWIRMSQNQRTLSSQYLSDDTWYGATINMIREAIAENQGVSIFAMLPVFLLCFWLAFRKTQVGKQMNLAEYIIVFVYQNCQLMIVHTARLLLTSSVGIADSFVFAWISVLPFIIWDYKQLFSISWWSSSWRTILFIFGIQMLILRFLLGAARTAQIWGAFWLS